MAEIKTEANELEETKKKLAAAEKKLKAAEKKEADITKAENAAIREADQNARSIKSILDAQPKVRIRLFKDDDKYKDDLVVGINGMIYQIQRGVEVEVPESVANLIRQSQNQDQNTATKIEELTSRSRETALS